MKRALVLCGGGSLGSYEMGVWRYLEEKGEHFDIVTGTSIGAINGAMYAIGAYRKCLHLWREATIDRVVKEGFDIADSLGETWKNLQGKKIGKLFSEYVKRGGLDISPFKELVKETIDPKKIKESHIQCGIVTTEFKNRKEVDILLNDEPLDLILPWLHASSACYPIFPLEKINGVSYIDGGYCNNLPIDFAIKLGAEEIVAVLLHSVPRNPQHPELMSLPFVRTIRPSRDTGSILYFKSERLLNNMALGYQDAMKAYGDAIGYTYCFHPDESFKDLADKIAHRFVRENLYRIVPSIEALYKGVQPRPKESTDLFIRGLEYLSEIYEINPYRIWKIDSLKETLLQKLSESELSYKESTAKTRITDPKLILGKLMTLKKKGESDEAWLSSLIKRKPEMAYLKVLLDFIL